ncbi:serine O-acetyltransferase EpsC [Salinarimonas chemoclinalis]|uniref:serine O-acetyltransferase EpsC n=1 Tax=Salinarimonas chemoclinalis TaxID=3241599 RepID=UPI003558AABF
MNRAGDTPHAIWAALCEETDALACADRPFAGRLVEAIGRRASFGDALAARIGGALGDPEIAQVAAEMLARDPALLAAAAEDLASVRRADPACRRLSDAFLFFKGYAALQAARLAGRLWRAGEEIAALTLQGASATALGVDIHPAADLGRRIVLDHADGLVVGETARIGDDCVLLHGVTLGATGRERGPRHPILERGVFVGARATIIGRIVVGERALVGAGAVVVRDVAPFATVIGCAAAPPSSDTRREGDAPRAIGTSERNASCPVSRSPSPEAVASAISTPLI